MPYNVKGKCVYKADTGEKVGCTKGPVSKYLGALHANVKKEGATYIRKKKWSPEVEKILKIIAPEVTEMQDYIGIDAPHDINRSTFDEVMETYVKKRTVRRLWARMNPRQKLELFRKVKEYLYEKAVESDPESYEADVADVVYDDDESTNGKLREIITQTIKEVLREDGLSK